MSMRPTVAAALAAAMLTMGMAGCLGSEDEGLEANQAQVGEPGTAVVDADGEPIAFAQATIYDGDGDRLVATSADGDGRLALSPPAGAERVLVTAAGYEERELPVDELGGEIELADASEQLRPAVDAGVDTLSFLEPKTLGAAYMADRPETCEVNNCGASEPVIEIAGDGTIYVSGVCCVGGSPPIWYSTDEGHSFELLRGDVLRDEFGIEGDFAIDEAGNLYFSDISVASGYLASWDADQEHRWTIPAGPFVPPVDRPWIEAGPEDTAWFLYNQVTSTLLYESTDGGKTWTLAKEFPGALGNVNRGPGLSELWVNAGGHLFHSEEGATGFEDLGEIPRPSDQGSRFQSYDIVAIDEAGDVWLVYDWTNGTSDAYHIYATPYTDEGFGEPVQISPDQGTHHLPWADAGAAGTLALAWYGTMDDEAHPDEVAEDAEWHLYSAASVDTNSDRPSFQIAKADPLPVHEGPMNRELLDFLQVEIGPEGGFHIAYAQDRDGQVDEVTEYVRTPTGLDLAREDYLNGP
jgi:hypothetical protein